MADVDDGAAAASPAVRNLATSSIGVCVADSPIRCSGAPPRRRAARELRASARPARPDDGVYLVDDDRAHRPQHLAAPFGREQQVQRFRGRHQDVRRRPPVAARSAGVVSPVRTAAVIPGARNPAASARRWTPRAARRGSCECPRSVP